MSVEQSFPRGEIKSKLLVLGADSTTISDQGCQHVTGRFESIRMQLNKLRIEDSLAQGEIVRRGARNESRNETKVEGGGK